jgi:hypothetical protein
MHVKAKQNRYFSISVIQTKIKDLVSENIYKQNTENSHFNADSGPVKLKIGTESYGNVVTATGALKSNS